MTIASSPMLALEHGHCGCANITRVARPFCRSIGAPAGQSTGGVAGRPGVLEYLHRTSIPKPTAGTHSATATTTAAGFFNLLRRNIPEPYVNPLSLGGVGQ